MRKVLVVLLALIGHFSLFSTAAIAKSGTLVMFDSHHCGACRQFKRETAGHYRRSLVGKKMPLHIVNVDGRAMKRYQGRIRPISFTPTFVLMRNGREIGRIIGYPGRTQFMRAARRLRKH